MSNICLCFCALHQFLRFLTTTAGLSPISCRSGDLIPLFFKLFYQLAKCTSSIGHRISLFVLVNVIASLEHCGNIYGIKTTSTTLTTLNGVLNPAQATRAPLAPILAPAAAVLPTSTAGPCKTWKVILESGNWNLESKIYSCKIVTIPSY